MACPERVKIVEVGARDGLQNETQTVPAELKVELIERLAACGLRAIEAGSFVNPKWVPQMASSDAVFAGITRGEGVCYSALTPNRRGFERALEAGADEVAVFASASESFSQKNINCSIAESLARFQPVMDAANAASIPVRGYTSCVIACPYEGAIDPEVAAQVSEQLLEMGCYEISLGDTIGAATPRDMDRLLEACTHRMPVAQLAVHCHDTYGMGIANIYAALQWGVAVVDSSVAGLGGCPYAHGATGNVATEDVVYLLEGLGIDHGIDLEQLAATGEFISRQLARENGSRVGRAMSARE